MQSEGNLQEKKILVKVMLLKDYDCPTLTNSTNYTKRVVKNPCGIISEVC